jgi:hypothetical protein
MSENQSQPNITGNPKNPGGEPQLQPDAGEARSFEARPSDSEAAHNSEEGGAVRDPRQLSDEHLDQSVDQNHGSLDGHPSKDLSGDAQVGERLSDRGHRL